MPKTLAGALPEFQKNLRDNIQKAAMDAFMSTVQSGGGDSQMNGAIEKQYSKASKKFADTFADSLAKPLAKTIMDFVLETGIIMTPTGTLIAPQAMSGALPVTGNVPINGFKLI